MRYEGWPPISCPRKRIEPRVGMSAPASRLNVVLLPEPFGPISPRISPCCSSKETWLTAVKPPKTFVSPWTDSIVEFRSSLARGGGFLLVGVTVGLGPRQHGVGRAQPRGPHYFRLAIDVLHDHWRAAFVLSRHFGAGWEEFH